ncbi:MAG: aminotransferase class V-fold PLP-dependent enzyme [candidate division WOR-3 bacterium]
MSSESFFAQLPEMVVGQDRPVPTLNGERRFVNLDNASSTPTLQPILTKVCDFLVHYSNVHRGTGFRSRLASWAFEEARTIIGRFVNADPEHDVVIFTRNTTEALNKLARLYPFRTGGIVLTTLMEHHSNDLPWRRRCRTVPIETRPDGALDLDHLTQLLAEFRGRVELVAVTGASNVTGFVNPIHEIARLAHEAGARVVVDAAQLAAHRPIDMKKHTDPEHIDFLAFSGHKMYAPFGVGVLVGDRRLLGQVEPDLVGGGVVHLVTSDKVFWNELPGREEAGTPAVVGAVALAAACRLLEKAGWDRIRKHEGRLAHRMVDCLNKTPGMRIYGATAAQRLEDRLPVFAFNINGWRHSLVAAILGCEGAIAVRCGLFCAHPYMLRLLDLDPPTVRKLSQELCTGNYSNLPGAVRASIGIYNTDEDIDALGEWLQIITAQRYQGRYRLIPSTGGYAPEPTAFGDYWVEQWTDLSQHFSFDIP